MAVGAYILLCQPFSNTAISTVLSHDDRNNHILIKVSYGLHVAASIPRYVRRVSPASVKIGSIRAVLNANDPASLLVVFNHQ